MSNERISRDPVPDAGFDYAGRLAAKGTPGSIKAADSRVHDRGIPCPDTEPRYLSRDRRMWLVLNPDFDQRKINDILGRAFPGKK